MTTAFLVKQWIIENWHRFFDWPISLSSFVSVELQISKHSGVSVLFSSVFSSVANTPASPPGPLCVFEEGFSSEEKQRWQGLTTFVIIDISPSWNNLSKVVGHLARHSQVTLRSACTISCVQFYVIRREMSKTIPVDLWRFFSGVPERLPCFHWWWF